MGDTQTTMPAGYSTDVQPSYTLHSDAQLYELLKYYLDRNFTPEQLKQYLTRQNWNSEQIDKVLAILLYNYVKFCINRNLDLVELREFLVFKGWTPEQIDDQLRALRPMSPY